ncbi:hypothetical protein GCM10010174_50750 [Kutzneria viridogrisea]|uniref:Peptidase C51 domain-containing protein n=2 Tax=Kutzneria TaxID=43356 RepID=W5WFF2_9PSEU|nr:CHAP domain-containing protein [Kutzneria albida]AHH99316.1 hypothetical protein KALB_5956 [Kutzneria albida DSM 43870]MBA8923130.1 hypothetical protein [Kutzneria viridogrisea]
MSTRNRVAVLLAGAAAIGCAALPAQAAAAPSDVRASIAKIALGEVGYEEGSNNCNKYGPCEEWCSLFATWVWNKAGDAIPHYAYTGDVYEWGVRNGRAHASNTGMKQGDVVLYGTRDNSLHIGVVVSVASNGQITTVEGNDRNAVRKDGPFDPTHAKAAGRPGNIYGWVSAV